MHLPTIHAIDKIVFPDPEELRLSNDIPVYGFNGTKNDILRIELVFNSGRWTEPAKLTADFAARLIKSGTAEMDAFTLSEQIDFYGSTIKASAGYNTFTVAMYCMNRFLEPTLELLMKCLTAIIFPEKEISLSQKNAISKLRVSQEKNDYLADVAFKHAVYGKDHPYGYETTEAAIHNIRQDLLQKFYQDDIHPGNCSLFIAGKYADHELRLIEQYLGNWKHSTSTAAVIPKTFAVNTGEKKIRIVKDKSVQASIIIGKQLFNKHHQDFAPFLLLNTIFGGYFGSRLMSNIREEKGLTYGIYSGLATLKHGGIFSIQTDTNLDTLDLCLQEIYKEIDRLHQTLISEKEITLARNYLLGKFLSRTDGPFNQVEVFKGYYIEGVNIHKFEEIEETIKQTDAVTLQQMAQAYLQKESMFETVAG